MGREKFVLDFFELRILDVPSTWEKPRDNQMRFLLSTISEEYRRVAFDFAQGMKGNLTQIIRIERIQNISCYTQYSACRRDFKRRLNIDTEKSLYHSCNEQDIDSIINGVSNENFIDIHGKIV